MQEFRLPEAVKKAISLLEASGFEAYLVGGCVRDMLMGQAPSDFDLTSSAKPKELAQVFQDYRIIETGVAHGTVTVLLDELPLEITTFRIEGTYSDGRRPDTVYFCSNLSQDLARRDFTMNAMAYHPIFGLVDPFEGQKDLHAGCIRCVGRAGQRFQEDALRLLRAIRFASTFGFFLEEETETALHLYAGGLLRIAPERIRAELDRLLCGKDAPRILVDYRDVLGLVLPELASLAGQQHEYLSETARALSYTPPQADLRWSVLLHGMREREWHTLGDGKERAAKASALYGTQSADTLLRRLQFDRKRRERIVRLIAGQETISVQDETALLARMSHYGKELFFELLQVNRAIQLAKSLDLAVSIMQNDEIEVRARRLFEEASCLSLKDLAVKGEDILSFGFKGPEVGKQLHFLLESVLTGKAKNEKAILLSLLKRKKE